MYEYECEEGNQEKETDEDEAAYHFYRSGDVVVVFEDTLTNENPRTWRAHPAPYCMRVCATNKM